MKKFFSNRLILEPFEHQCGILSTGSHVFANLTLYFWLHFFSKKFFHIWIIYNIFAVKFDGIRNKVQLNWLNLYYGKLTDILGTKIWYNWSTLKSRLFLQTKLWGDAAFFTKKEKL